MLSQEKPPKRPIVQGVDYERNTCGKMVCPPCQPLRYQVVEDPATEGEELIFLVKPENFCCGIPFCIDHRTIDIHRVTKDGTVEIGKYGICSSRQVKILDAVKVEGRPLYGGSQALNYISSTLQAYSIERIPNDLLLDAKGVVRDRVNQFLEERRLQIGSK